ncbi:MAG TPA: DUF1302 family protein [Halanaerobiales bacterium]|nr:DUF1302 family protein [Halanaerobiales bacterium]
MFKKIAVLFVISLFLVTSSAIALTESLGGKLEQDIIYNNAGEEWQGKSLIELELDKSFGFDKKLYINSEIYTNYLNEKFTDLKIDFNEAYFDLYLKNSDLTIGKQMINWGSAYEINPSSMTNPYDLTALNPTEEKLGVPAIRNTYYFNNRTSLTGVVITDFVKSPVPASLKENMIKGIKADFAEQLTKQGVTNPNLILNNNLEVVESEPEIDEIGELEYAVNLMKRNVRGFDLSASYFNGYEDIPSITSDLDNVKQDLKQIVGEYQRNNYSDTTTALDIDYKRTQGIGLNAIGSISSVGVWSELNYQINEDDEKTIDLILGGDYTFDNKLYTVAQFIHRGYSDHQIPRESMNYLLLHGDKPFKQIHTIKANLIYDLGLGNYMFNPEMTFSLSNNINLDLGTVITGEKEGTDGYALFNMMSGERTYFELTYNF